MDMKYKDRNEIIAQILESTNGNRVRLTKIMYDVYLSHGLTKEYVRLLIEKGLIEYLDGERTFKTTDTGMNFLRIHNKVQLTLLATKSQRREILGDPSTIKKAENCYHQTSGSSTGRQTSEQQQISQH
jgi:predicted transcriptional regulator